MEFVNIFGDEDMSSYPQPFLPEEIDRICDVLDTLPIEAVDEFSENQLRKDIKQFLKDELPFYQIVRIEEAIFDLSEVLTKRFLDAKANDGYSAGFTSAHSVSSAITQATMDSFNDTNTAAAIVGGRIRDATILIYANKRRDRSNRMFVHFNTRVTKADIIEMRAVMVEVKARRLVENYDIRKLAPADNPRKQGYHQRYPYHDAYEIYKEQSFPDTLVMRLKLDKDMMFIHRISRRMFVDSIIDPESGLENPKRIWIVPSPFDYGLIDIVAIPDVVLHEKGKTNKGQSKQWTLESFLGTFILELLDKIVVKGVDGIFDLYPKNIRMDKIFTEPRRTGEYTWDIFIDRTNKMLTDAVFTCFDELKQELDTAGMEYEDKHDQNGKLIGFSIDQENVTHVTEKTKLMRNPCEILNILHGRGKVDIDYWYMTTNGSNYKKILEYLWVDPDRTISNNIHDIKSYLGCEASRKYFLFELEAVLFAIRCGDINPKHLLLISDVIYFTGNPEGMTLQGNIARRQSMNQLAVNQQGGKIYKTAAINKSKAPAEESMTAVVFGGKIPAGEKAIKESKPTAKPEAHEQLALENTRKKEKFRAKREPRLYLKEREDAFLKQLHGLASRILHDFPDNVTVPRQHISNEEFGTFDTSSEPSEYATINVGDSEPAPVDIIKQKSIYNRQVEDEFGAHFEMSEYENFVPLKSINEYATLMESKYINPKLSRRIMRKFDEIIELISNVPDISTFTEAAPLVGFEYGRSDVEKIEVMIQYTSFVPMEDLERPLYANPLSNIDLNSIMSLL